MSNAEMKAVAKVEPQTTAVSAAANQALQDLGISASDLTIPKILLMQNTSERVGMGTAAFGDMINSVTGEKVGDFSKGMEFIPLKITKNWVVLDISQGTPKYVRMEPVTAQNEKRDWEGVENGNPVRFDLSLDVYVLMIKDITEGEAFPYVISFRRTSYPAGRALATQILKQAILGKPVYNKVMVLKPERQKADTNVYGVYSVQPSRVATEPEKEQAKIWLGLVTSKQYSVDNSDVAGGAPADTSSERPVAPTIVGSAVKGGSKAADGDLY